MQLCVLNINKPESKATSNKKYYNESAVQWYYVAGWHHKYANIQRPTNMQFIFSCCRFLRPSKWEDKYCKLTTYNHNVYNWYQQKQSNILTFALNESTCEIASYAYCAWMICTYIALNNQTWGYTVSRDLKGL